MNNLLDILRVGVFAARPAPTPIWASESGLKYHIETAQSDAANGETFTALCGFSGLFQHQRNERHTFLRCFDCERIQAQSTTGILDVADQGRSTTELTESITVGTELGSGEMADAPEASGSLQVRLLPSQLQILPVPLGREFSGGVEGHATARRGQLHRDSDQKSGDAQVRLSTDKGIHPSFGVESRVGDVGSENQASPADQILPEPVTLQQTGAAASTSLDAAPERFSDFIDRVLVCCEPKLTQKQRIDGEMRLIHRGRA